VGWFFPSNFFGNGNNGAGGEPKFGGVVIPAAPVEINAGDSIGHMGFYELPEEDGKQSRYQVHIECLSMDSKLPTFLTNPDKVGGDSPTFLKYPEGAKLYAKDAEGTMKDTGRVRRATGILTLSGVPVIKAGEAVTHYQIHPESCNLIEGEMQPDIMVESILNS
jgi:hypothetical protein